MSRYKQETATTFAEVFSNSEVSCQQNRAAGTDNRIMLYFQGMKLYIPDGVSYETLLTMLRAMKQL